MLAGLLTSIQALGFSYTMRLSEAELQARIERLMPFERTQYLFTVSLSEPLIELSETDNQIALFSAVSVLGPAGLQGRGSAKVKGSIRYERAQGAFFIDQPSVEQLEIERMPRRLSGELIKVVQTIVSKALAKYPVYTLREEDAKQKLAKSMIDSIRVENKELIVKLKPM